LAGADDDEVIAVRHWCLTRASAMVGVDVVERDGVRCPLVRIEH
jgi:hypothetical protein